MPSRARGAVDETLALSPPGARAATGRRRTDRIFTLDQRDFRAMSPLTPGLDAFRILPADG